MDEKKITIDETATKRIKEAEDRIGRIFTERGYVTPHEAYDILCELLGYDGGFPYGTEPYLW